MKGPSLQIKTIKITHKDIFVAGKPMTTSISAPRSMLNPENNKLKKILHFKSIIEKRRSEHINGIAPQKPARCDNLYRMLHDGSELRRSWEPRHEPKQKPDFRNGDIKIVTRQNFRTHAFSLSRKESQSQKRQPFIRLNKCKTQGSSLQKTKLIPEYASQPPCPLGLDSYLPKKVKLSVGKAKSKLATRHNRRLSTCESIQALNYVEKLQDEDDDLDLCLSNPVGLSACKAGSGFELQGLCPWKTNHFGLLFR